jgi:hypothetical protein
MDMADVLDGGVAATDRNPSPPANEVVLRLTEQQVELLENLRSQDDTGLSLEDLILSLLDGYRQSLIEE